MPSITKLFSGLLVAASVATIQAAPTTNKRAQTKPHDQIVGFPDETQASAFFNPAKDPETKLAYTLSLPYLKVDSGCVPFPAVDKDGFVSEGLQETGGENEGCSRSTGQVYGRSAEHKGRVAVMWSWYFPKDAPPNLNQGHRHDWENVVVWFSNVSVAEIYGVAYSGHGGYTKEAVASLDDTKRERAHPFAQYYSEWPLNHQLGPVSSKGGQQPSVTWEGLSEPARTALGEHDFGSANVPFKDGSFEANLDKAWID